MKRTDYPSSRHDFYVYDSKVIDEQKVLAAARESADDGNTVIVHYHDAEDGSVCDSRCRNIPSSYGGTE